MYRTLTVVVIGLVLAVGIGQSASNKRAYVAGHFALELDGAMAGVISSPDGGGISADVETREDETGVLRKHVGGVKYEGISFRCGTGMSKALYDWVSSSLVRKGGRRNGAIVAADFDYKEHRRIEFNDALITEIGFPALDGASKDPAYLTIRIEPETIRHVKGSGKPVPIDPRVQKKWLPANFRLRIDGLEEPCSRVNKIEALTVKQKVAEDPAGGLGVLQDVPDLAIALPDAFADPIRDWHTDFAIRGNNGQEAEKAGTLEYLAPDLKEVLFTVRFRNLGIFKVAPDKTEAGGEQIRRLKAEMYCEEMEFSHGAPVE